MIQYLGNNTPPADVKYSVYEMEQVSAYAKKKEDEEAARFVSDEEAEARYQKNRRAELIKDRVKKILIIAGICVFTVVLLISGYITLFME